MELHRVGETALSFVFGSELSQSSSGTELREREENGREFPALTTKTRTN